MSDVDEQPESSMTPDHWERLKELFTAAAPLSVAERDAFVAANCGTDRELRVALERLLLRHDSAEGFLTKPLARIPEPASRRTFAPGEVIANRLTVDSLLGAGGMGEVYKALDTRLERVVAVKVLPRILNDREHRRRLEREAKAVAVLSHPNICSLYDVDTDQGRAYLVFEYLEGQTLAARLREAALPIEDCRRIAAEVSAALAYAHDRGVIHRDLKPANIMLTPFGAKVLDFGIAKRHAGVTASDRSNNEDFGAIETVTGQVLGSVAYMSPEQAEGKPVDHRSDVFSFGCVLYEMITRQKAFRGDTPAATMAAVLRSQPVPIRELIATAPADLDAILDKCLQKNVADRYQSMREVAAALDTAWSSGPATHRSERTSPALFGFRALNRRRTAALIAALITTATLAIWWPGRVGETQPENSAIVLPFANVSGDPELEYLADGFSESLTNTLSRIPVLRVIARTTAFRYKGQEVDVQKIGRDLNVGVLVTGKLSRVGEQVRLQADLIDARDGIQIWGQEYTTTRGDTLSVQADVVRNLTARLATRLTDEEKREISRHSTRRSDAYDSYLKGRYALMRFTVSDIQKSIGHFQNALQADPSYALAYTGLADSYWMLSSMFLKPSDAMTKARAAAEKALSVDPMLAEAHMSRGVVRGWYEFDWKRSESELRKAIELNPNDATARLWYAWNLVLNGQIRKGIEEARIAHDLDPLSPYVETGLAQMIAYSGDHQAAIRRLQGVNGLDPDFFGGHHYLGTLYVAAKQYRAAAASFEQARRLDPEQPQPIAYLAYARAMIGDVESARSLVAELTNLARKRYVSGFLFAVASLALGSDQEAVAWLEKASEERDDMVSLLAIDRLFDGLRPNPRFQAVMRKVGFGELNTDTRSRSSTR